MKIGLCTLLSSLLLLSASAVPPDDAPRGFLFVANQFEHTALLIDLTSHKLISTTGVDINGHEVVVSSDGRLGYVPIYGNAGVGKPGTDGGTIQVVDLQTGRAIDIINLPKPVRPHCAKFGPGGLLYVTAELANAVYAIDVHSRKVVAEIPTGRPESHMLVISPDGARAYTANVSSGTVSVLDLRKHALITVIPVAKTVQRLSLSPDGKWLFTHDQDTPGSPSLTLLQMPFLAGSTFLPASILPTHSRWKAPHRRFSSRKIVRCESGHWWVGKSLWHPRRPR